MPATTSRSRALTPATPVRWVLTVVFGAFLVGFGHNVAWAVRGQIEWTLGYKIGFPLLALLAVGSLVGLVAAWTNRVWIDYERNEVHQFLVYRDVVRPLDPPGTARLDYTPAALGATVSGTWKVVFEQPGLTGMSVGTPWVSDITDVLRALQPSLRRNPALAADDATRAAIENPGDLHKPVAD